MVEDIVDALARLDPSPEDQVRAREALLSQLVAATNPQNALWLLNAVLRLAPAAEDPSRHTDAKIDWLIRETGPERARQMGDQMTNISVWLNPPAQAREALPASHKTDFGPVFAELRQATDDFYRSQQELIDLPENERARTLEGMLSHMLAGEKEHWRVRLIADWFATLDPASEARTRAQETLLSLLKDETDPRGAKDLADAVSMLSPTVADLSGSETWPFPPTPGLLAAARRNSGLPAWLAALPLLSRSAHTAADSDSAPTPPNNG
jgi:hypothetical protein